MSYWADLRWCGGQPTLSTAVVAWAGGGGGAVTVSARGDGWTKGVTPSLSSRAAPEVFATVAVRLYEPALTPVTLATAVSPLAVTAPTVATAVLSEAMVTTRPEPSPVGGDWSVGGV